MILQGLFWNCRGIKKKGVSTFLKDLIIEKKFHFIGLQETMVAECSDSLLRKFDGNQDYLWMYNPSKGKSGGILVGILLERFDAGSFTQEEFMLKINLWDKSLKVKWNLLVVYGAAQEEKKMAFLAELSHFCASNSEPMIIGGDFNIIRYIKEKNTMDGVHRHTPLFNSIIHFYELRELVMAGGMFTWSNNQEVPTLEKTR